MSVDPEATGHEEVVPGSSLDRELTGLRDQMARLRSENARLLRLLELTPTQARPPGPTQTGIFDGPPGMVDASSSLEAKVAFFASMFAARSDVYAVRWENTRTGRSGWMPAVRGGWRKGVAAGSREYAACVGTPQQEQHERARVHLGRRLRAIAADPHRR